MKKTLLIGLVVVVVAALAGGLWTVRRDKAEVERMYVQSQAAGDSLRTRFDQALVSIAEIQDSLTAIMPSESAVMDVSKDVEGGGTLTASRKDQVLRSISDLNDSIRRSKEMIGRLEQRLDESDVKIASLERVISNMKKTVAEREQTIAMLTERVENLNVEVAGLKTDVETKTRTIQEKEQVIETKRRELSTVYYIVDTKKNLKQLGVVETAGGVIGIGKSTRLSGQFPEAYFSNVDTDQQTVIPLAGKEPRVLSGQNNASYQIVPVGADQSELRIVNPEEFRKVRYLVVQVG